MQRKRKDGEIARRMRKEKKGKKRKNLIIGLFFILPSVIFFLGFFLVLGGFSFTVDFSFSF